MKKNKRETFDKFMTKNLHFKKEMFSDKSEYWFKKSFKFPVFGKIEAVVDTESGVMTLEVKSNLTRSMHSVEHVIVDYKVNKGSDVERILRKNIKF
jgi:hypothetical protein